MKRSDLSQVFDNANDVFMNGALQQVTAFLLSSQHRRNDGFDHASDGVRRFDTFCDNLDCRLHRSAAFMSKHDYKRNAKELDRVLDRA